MGDLTKQKKTSSKQMEPSQEKFFLFQKRDISRLYYTSFGSLLNIEESRLSVVALEIIKGLPKSRIIKEGVLIHCMYHIM